MTLPLEGRWNVIESGNAAATILPPLASWIEITANTGNYVGIVDKAGHTWTIGPQSVDNGLICGGIDSGSYSFVITVFGSTASGKPKAFGIIYGSDFGDGHDPGTWEAEGEGVPEG